MKRILITGKDSYIGTSFEKWCSQYPDKYTIDTIDMRVDSWREVSFAVYDAVFHVAGIAHVSAKRKMEQLYYKVNRDIAIEAAEKAKKDGVKQFIFMSSIMVYGDCGGKSINRDTVPKPDNFYGKSKLDAERGIEILQNEGFKTVIIRPPMVYGKGCKGNYQKLSKLARITPIFPEINNKRSMIHIDNLCEFIRLVVETETNGVLFPQNKEFVKTTEMIKTIAQIYEKKILYVKIFNPFIKLIKKHMKIINKIFGDLIYEQMISSYNFEYQIRNLVESIKMTEQEIQK